MEVPAILPPSPIRSPSSAAIPLPTSVPSPAAVPSRTIRPSTSHGPGLLDLPNEILLKIFRYACTSTVDGRYPNWRDPRDRMRVFETWISSKATSLICRELWAIGQKLLAEDIFCVGHDSFETHCCVFQMRAMILVQCRSFRALLDPRARNPRNFVCQPSACLFFGHNLQQLVLQDDFIHTVLHAYPLGVPMFPQLEECKLMGPPGARSPWYEIAVDLILRVLQCRKLRVLKLVKLRVQTVRSFKDNDHRKLRPAFLRALSQEEPTYLPPLLCLSLVGTVFVSGDLSLPGGCVTGRLVPIRMIRRLENNLSDILPMYVWVWNHLYVGVHELWVAVAPGMQPCLPLQDFFELRFARVSWQLLLDQPIYNTYPCLPDTLEELLLVIDGNRTPPGFPPFLKNLLANARIDAPALRSVHVICNTNKCVGGLPRRGPSSSNQLWPDRLYFECFPGLTSSHRPLEDTTARDDPINPSELPFEFRWFIDYCW